MTRSLFHDLLQSLYNLVFDFPPSSFSSPIYTANKQRFGRCSSFRVYRLHPNSENLQNEIHTIYIHIWVFPKIGGKPENGWFIMVPTLLKWMIWEYPYFWKYPYMTCLFRGASCCSYLFGKKNFTRVVAI